MPKMDAIRAFSHMETFFFDVQKRIGEACPLTPSCTPVRVDEYASIPPNVRKYP